MKNNPISQTVSVLRRILREPYYVAAAVLGGGAMLSLQYWLLTRVTTVNDFVQMAKNGEYGPFSTAYGIAYGIMTALFVLLFGLSFALLVWQFKHSFAGRIKNAGAHGLGALGGALGSGCPVCGAFLLQLAGVTAGFGAFPLQGLEFQALGLGIVAATTLLTAKKVAPTLETDCAECNVTSRSAVAPFSGSRGHRVVSGLENALIVALIVLFAANHLLIGQVASAMGMKRATGGSGGVGRFIGSLVGAKTAAAKIIIAPKLNPDGRTTSLAEQPTITDVPANPNTGNALDDAKVVMIATGKPFYAPDDISFDDPVNAQEKWGAYQGIKLAAALEARYQTLVSTMTCSYCCGGPTNVTRNKQCGCAHAQAVRGFYKYMLQTYGDAYTDEQLIGESHRWYALWYPKGMLEDYLLATGKGDVIGHDTHGGAGSDGRHGF